MTTRYGSAISSSLGTEPNAGVIASCSCRASKKPKSSAPSTTGHTFQRPKMTSAMQIQPRPLTMSRVKVPSTERVRNDPPSAISAPPTTSARPPGAGHRDAGGVGRLRVLADGGQPQAGPGRPEHPPHAGASTQEGDEGHRVLRRGSRRRRTSGRTSR